MKPVFTMIFTALLVLTACATSQEIMTSMGERGHLVNCSGASNWDSCYKKAAQLCGTRGYTIQDKNSDQIINTVGLDKDAPTVTIIQRTLLISCGR